MNTIILESKKFAERVKNQINLAQEKGALESIPTSYEIISDGGIDFIVRIVTNLMRKEKAKKQKAKNPEFNPFLPYDLDLFVSDISDTHLCLLNKYNVVDEHLLIVTRQFEEQENLLNFDDFLSLWAVLQEFNGLAFYNSGKIAGASVRHKHLQLIPREFTPRGIPIETVFNGVVFQEEIGIINSLPFGHAYSVLNNNLETLEELAKTSVNIYQNLLTSLNLQEGLPYNLLMTKEWMLIIPRSQPCYQDIGINSLGFSGAMLVRNQQELELVKECGPLEILKKVGFSQPTI